MFGVCWYRYWIIFVLIELFLSRLWQTNKNFFWIIIKKICLRQQRINGNDAIFFWYFEFWVKIDDFIREKFWRKQNNEKSWKILTYLKHEKWFVIVPSDFPYRLLEVLYLFLVFFFFGGGATIISCYRDDMKQAAGHNGRMNSH